MSIEKVRAYFKPLGIEERIREFDVSSATVELAAVAVGVEGARIAKSLSFKVEDKPIIIVVAGDAKVDNSRYKAQFHTKAKMLTHEEAHELIGHDVGGVCPFALPEDVKVYLDVSMKRFETVFPAAGSSNSAVEMTCDELERYASNFAAWVDVCKGWRPEEQGCSGFCTARTSTWTAPSAPCRPDRRRPAAGRAGSWLSVWRTT